MLLKTSKEVTRCWDSKNWNALRQAKKLSRKLSTEFGFSRLQLVFYISVLQNYNSDTEYAETE